MNLPARLTFWRRQAVQNACKDPATRRSPLFDYALVGGPRQILRIDTLHTLYLGVYQTYAASVIWDLVAQNPWGVEGSK
eukprot:7666306-Pyramimonas_sp.AAC.1